MDPREFTYEQLNKAIYLLGMEVATATGLARMLHVDAFSTLLLEKRRREEEVGYVSLSEQLPN